jgi:hypothetical protein
MADATDDTDQIERDLAQTRARMDRRLDELGDKLQPNQLVNDALAQVTGGDGADFTQTLIAKAKANPIPAALTAVGIAWLMASSQNKARKGDDLPTRLRSAEKNVVRLQDEHEEVHASRLDDARGQVLGIARAASDTAATYRERISEAMAAATQSVRTASHDLGTGTSSALNRFSAQARKGTGAQSLLGTPVVLGTAAALVGLVAGALIPVSDKEEQALGSVAGRLRSQGRDLAQDVVNRGAQVAGDALGAVKDRAQAHGLTGDKPVGELLGDLKSGELLGHVKQAAQEIAGAGKDSLRSQLAGDGKGNGEQG